MGRATSSDNRDEAIELAQKFLDLMNSGKLDEVTNTTVTSVQMQIPPPDPEIPAWFDPIGKVHETSKSKYRRSKEINVKIIL